MEKEIEEFLLYCAKKTLHKTHIDILKLLARQDMSMMELCGKLKFDTKGNKLPLLSYYINGNYRSEGLIELNLISSKKQGAKKMLTLTPLGLSVLIFMGEK